MARYGPHNGPDRLTGRETAIDFRALRMCANCADPGHSGASLIVAKKKRDNKDVNPSQRNVNLEGVTCQHYTRCRSHRQLS